MSFRKIAAASTPGWGGGVRCQKNNRGKSTQSKQILLEFHFFRCHVRRSSFVVCASCTFTSRATKAPSISTPVGSTEAPCLHLHPPLLASEAALSSSSLVVVGALITRVGSSRHLEYKHAPGTLKHGNSTTGCG